MSLRCAVIIVLSTGTDGSQRNLCCLMTRIFVFSPSVVCIQTARQVAIASCAVRGARHRFLLLPFFFFGNSTLSSVKWGNTLYIGTESLYFGTESIYLGLSVPIKNTQSSKHGVANLKIENDFSCMAPRGKFPQTD